MKKNISELSVEELHKQKSTLKAILIGTGIIMVIASAIILYLMLKKQNFALLAVLPISFLSMIPSVVGLTQVSKEIRKRKSP